MVVFTNTQFSTLQICKIGVGATVGRSFSFTITGGSSVTTPISITAGYPAANCKTVSGTFLTGSQVGVSEAAQSNTSTTVSVNGGTATSGTSATFNLASGLNTVTFTNKIAKAQGCSPGFFKNHPGAFTPPYTPSTKVGLVFTAAFGDLRSETLEDALQGGGGPGLLGAEKILLRAAVAALLNAANPNISYPLATAQVIAQVNAALASNNRQTMLNLASQLDIDNNLGCPIGGDNGSDS
jgi:hypothetical protein